MLMMDQSMPHQEERVVIESSLPQPVVTCILLNKGKYVMQLRDDKPDINSPGLWGLFGGYRREFEDPMTAISRELKEELGIEINPVRRFIDGIEYTSHLIFLEDISNQYDQIVLGEGQDFGSFSLAELGGMKVSAFSLEILKKFENQK